MSWRTTLVLLAVAVLLGAGIWLSNRREAEQHEAEERTRRLFGALEAAQVEWVALTASGGEAVRLERRDGAWRVVEPVDFPADPANADSLASALASMTSEAVIEEPQPPAVYGLGEGARTVRFGAGGSEHELRIGKKTPVGGNHYAATSGAEGATVYTVATFRTTAFDKALDDLRERRPLRFERGDVTRIEAEWTGGRVVVEKQDGAWKLVEPVHDDADQDAIENLLSDLVFLRAAGFVDEPSPPGEVGLDRPEYRVVLTGTAEPGKQAPRYELSIGSMIATNARAGKAAEAALYEIPEDRFQKLPKKVEAFRFKQLARFAASDADRFELIFHDTEAAAAGASSAVTIEGTRTESGWDTTPEPMAAGTAARMIAELAELDAAEIAADEVGPQELAGLGFAPPRATIRVYGAVPEGGGEAPVLAEVLLGVQSGSRIAARRPDRPTIFRIDAAHAEHVPVSLEAFRNRFEAREDEAAPAADGGEAPPAPPDAGAAPPGP